MTVFERAVQVVLYLPFAALLIQQIRDSEWSPNRGGMVVAFILFTLWWFFGPSSVGDDAHIPYRGGSL